MQYRPLGRSGLEVSTLCLGTWEFADDFVWSGQTEADSIATIHHALDIGVNFVDTAESYGAGRSEEIIGRALRDRRQEVILASKVAENHLKPEDLVTACENSLRRLQTDYIDLYQIHWPNHDLPLDDSLAALERLRAAGKIRAIGVSNFGARDLDDLLSVGRADANQMAYSLLFRAIEFEILPLCRDDDIGILCYSPLMHGILAGKFATAGDVPDERARTRHFSPDRPHTMHAEAGCEEEMFQALAEIRRISGELGHSMAEIAVAWLVHQPGVTSVIAGARRPDQLTETAKAAAIELSSDVLAQLDQATAPVKAKLGANADMWRTQSRIR